MRDNNLKKRHIFSVSTSIQYLGKIKKRSIIHSVHRKTQKYSQKYINDQIVKYAPEIFENQCYKSLNQ